MPGLLYFQWLSGFPMERNRYKPGDMIVVRTGIMKSAQPQGAGEILAVLPETRGVLSYRVRFQAENFERNVSQDEIDIDASAHAGDESANAVEEKSSSWIKPSAIRVKK